jgi:RNA polymerase sigma-70 factor (ECF subfamily)
MSVSGMPAHDSTAARPLTLVRSSESVPGVLDAGRFSERVDALRPELRRAALRFAGNEADADDLLQEAVLRAWTFRRGFAPGTNFRAWMHRILRNVGITGFRRRRREREALDRHRQESALWEELRLDGPAVEAGSGVEAGLGDELAAALQALPSPYADTVRLVDVRGLSYEEAAERLGCPVGTVMSRLHRARRALRRHLEAPPVGKAA